jgi:hypothetical protein
MKRVLWVFVVCGVVGGFAGARGQEVGPLEIIEAKLPVLVVPVEDVPVLATGTIETIGGCDFCYLHDTQYRITVPEGVVRLVIELTNADDPLGDIDLIVREGQPVTEDETSYHYSYRTYGDTGEECLELPEEGFETVTPGEYYVAVITYVEQGSAFEIRAAAYVEQILPQANVLTPNVPVSNTLGPFTLSGDLAWQYAIDVRSQAEYVLVHTSSDGALDVFVGESPVGRDEWGDVSASFQLLGATGDDVLAIRTSALNRYWIVVGNPTSSPVHYELRVTSLPEVVSVKMNEAVAGTVGWEAELVSFVADRLETDDGVLGLLQYRVDLPETSQAMSVQLRGNEASQIGLHLKYGHPITVANGTVLADLSIVEGQEKNVVLRGSLIRETPLFIGVEALSDGEKAFSLEVNVVTEEETEST